LEIEFDAALKNASLEVYYQPKIATADFSPCGAEALLRWQSPTRGAVLFTPSAPATADGHAPGAEH
jgi:EAL domain-containing protein (putative c-di-GMP-specific phosphodiesterase class I)